MKLRIPQLALFLLSLFLIAACSLDEETLADIVADENPPVIPPEAPEGALDVDTTPCTYDLSILTADETLLVDCQLDLGGTTVDLPSNVTLEYDGGEIINGTVNFDGGKIDGRLLNINLEIVGSVSLIDPNFHFYSERWNIVEGNTVKETALNNHFHIQKSLDLAHSLGANVFSLGSFDAYFYHNKKSRPIIEFPSDIHFKMSDGTHLRIFAVDENYVPWMFRIRNQRNVTISGGTLHGERDDFSPNIESGGVLIWIMSGWDVTVDNVRMVDGSSTGLTINSYLFADNPDYEPSRNVVVKNCYFDNNRTNNLSITDAKDIIVENNELYRAGVNTAKSLGRAPRIGIVIEPVTGQKVEGVIIRNNILKETGGKSAILVALGDDVTITGNSADKQVGWTSASNIRVVDNPGLRGGIIAGFTSNYGLSQSMNNVISGNTITGAPTGIYATNDDIKIFDNVLKDCKVGMQLAQLVDSEIYNNSITSNVTGSFGFRAQKFVNNVTIRNNSVDLSDGRAIGMSSINKLAEYANFSFEFKDNTFESSKSSSIANVRGLNLAGNNFNVAGLGFTNGSNISVTNNTFKVSAGDCLNINKSISTKNFIVTGNSIENLNSARLAGYGLKILSYGSEVVEEDTNIIVEDNTVKVNGQNHAIYVRDMDGLEVRTNIGEHTGTLPYIYFRGDNSEIINNEVAAGLPEYDIQGNNNVVSGNN